MGHKLCNDCKYYKTESRGYIAGCHHDNNLAPGKLIPLQPIVPGEKLNRSDEEFPIDSIEKLNKDNNCDWYEAKD